MWMIQKVGLDEDGNIDRVQWQVADTHLNAWVGMPVQVPVLRVVDAILIGRVGSVMPTEDGHEVQGPYVRTVALGGGVEGIEADPSDGETRSLLDLQKL